MNCAAEASERFEEELRHEVRLKPSGIRAFHVFADLLNASHVHAVARESPFFKKLLTSLAVGQVVDGLEQPRFDLGLVAVEDGLDQQVTQ